MVSTVYIVLAHNAGMQKPAFALEASSYYSKCDRNVKSTWSSFLDLSDRARSQALSHNW